METTMFGRHRNTRPETVIKAMQEARAEREAAEPPRPRVTEHGYILPRVYDQSERDHRADSPEVKRARRRSGLSVVYGPDFVLSHEVAAVLGDLGQRDPLVALVRQVRIAGAE
ncbi:hypothetical protein, partial [Nocardia cyriacigeorgica]|uniref:hypothetical protein n=1 Tax=Nocardia cyriacigeorgica TaxID=135487 RepID=UPI002453B37B